MQPQIVTNREKLCAYLDALDDVLKRTRARLTDPLEPARWEGDEYVEAETPEDRAFIVLDELQTDLVWSLFEHGDSTPTQIAEYVRMSAQLYEHQRDLGEVVAPPAFTLVDPAGYIGELCQAAGEADAVVVWTTHPDDWDFVKGCRRERAA